MCSVAFGVTSGGRMPTAFASSNTARVYFSAISSGASPSSSTASSILSTASGEDSSVMCPTSVMFMTRVTENPSSSSARRMRSESMYVRKFPRCAVRYTVGPHAYILTWPRLDRPDLLEFAGERVVEAHGPLRIPASDPRT